MRLDFRVEAFTLLDRVVFSAPTTNVNRDVFGVITARQNSARQMQFNLNPY